MKKLPFLFLVCKQNKTFRKTYFLKLGKKMTKIILGRHVRYRGLWILLSLPDINHITLLGPWKLFNTRFEILDFYTLSKQFQKLFYSKCWHGLIPIWYAVCTVWSYISWIMTTFQKSENCPGTKMKKDSFNPTWEVGGKGN